MATAVAPFPDPAHQTGHSGLASGFRTRVLMSVAHGNRWGYLRLGIQGSLQRGASSGSLEMNPAPIQIVGRHRFEDMFLKSSHHWVISIREADEI